MKLNQLDIEYFRCFKRYHIDFAPGTTVLIGKNGAGKSTLIHAIHKALSFVFKKDTKVKSDRTLTAGIPSLKVEAFNKVVDLERNPETGLAFPYININAKGNFFNEILEWEIYASTSTFAIQSSRYSEAFTQFIDIVDEKDTYPVLAFYSDSFPHIESKAQKANKKLSSLRNFGYYQWNEETACSSIWIDKYQRAWKEWDRRDRLVKDLEQRINKCETMFKEGILPQTQYDEDINYLLKRKETIESPSKERIKAELEAIENCLKKFTEGDPIIEIQNLFLDVYNEELCIESTQGDNPTFKKLPAGYKRLLYIVLDIAYRSYILNGTTQSSGIVIIDEVDLHLHPSLEQSALQRLRNTFPHIQFIVSTHSPLVIANLNTAAIEEGEQINKAYMMQSGTERPISLPNLYGVDYNATMRDFMETPDRNKDISRLTEDYFAFKSMGMETEATSIYSKIISIVGKDNTTVLDKIKEQLNQL